MSQSPLTGNDRAIDQYMDNWNALAMQIKRGQSFSGRERNRCFLNTRTGSFADVSAVTGFDLPDDGRGIATTDWDQDGDLDFWIVNRTGPRLRLLLNQLQETNTHSISLRLQGVRSHRDAIGARVTLTPHGQPPIAKTLRAGDGFASQSSKWLHFGLGTSTQVDRITVAWPGDAQPQEFAGDDLRVNARYLLVQDAAVPRQVSRTVRNVSWANPEKLADPPQGPGASARIVLTQPRPLKSLTYEPLESPDDGRSTIKHIDEEGSGPTLLVLWASWCQPCVEELAQLGRQIEKIEATGTRVIALSTDALAIHRQHDSVIAAQQAARNLAGQLNVNYTIGFATEALLDSIVAMEHSTFYRQRDLQLPYAVLINAAGEAAVVYRGRLPFEKLHEDIAIRKAARPSQLAAARPFGGRQIAHWLAPTPLNFAKAFFEARAWDEANDSVLAAIEADNLDDTQLLQAWQLRVEIAKEQDDINAEILALRELIRREPDNIARLIRLVVQLQKADQAPDEIARITTQLSSQASADPMLQLANAYTQAELPRPASSLLESLKKRADQLTDRQRTDARVVSAAITRLNGDTRASIQALERILKDSPHRLDVVNNLAWILSTHPEPQYRNAERALELSLSAIRKTNASVTPLLDTHAAALANAGRYSDAATQADNAAKQAMNAGEFNLARSIRKRKQLYIEQEPYRDSTLTSSR